MTQTPARDSKPNLEVPSDPTATAYPLFWEALAAVDVQPEFESVHPNRPDRFCPRDSAPTGRVTVGLGQALSRNRREPSRDSGAPAPGPGTTPTGSSSGGPHGASPVTHWEQPPAAEARVESVED